MMYAIISDRGKQYNVTVGKDIIVDFISKEAGEEIAFDKIMFYSDDKNIKMGKPTVKGISVKAKIKSHFKSKKEVVYKYKRRKGFHKKSGSRQDFTILEILTIG